MSGAWGSFSDSQLVLKSSQKEMKDVLDIRVQTRLEDCVCRVRLSGHFSVPGTQPCGGQDCPEEASAMIGMFSCTFPMEQPRVTVEKWLMWLKSLT